jgi:hypothetical protein
MVTGENEMSTCSDVTMNLTCKYAKYASTISSNVLALSSRTLQLTMQKENNTCSIIFIKNIGFHPINDTFISPIS